MNRKRKRIGEYSQRHRRNILNSGIELVHNRLYISDEDSSDDDEDTNRTVITSKQTSPSSSASPSTNHGNSTSLSSAEHASPTRSVDSAINYVNEASDSESNASFAMSEDYRYSSSDMYGISDLSAYEFSDDSSDSEDYFHDETKKKRCRVYK